YIMNNKVPHLYASILQNKYTKDNDLLLKKQQDKIEKIDINIQNNKKKSKKLKALIDNYSEKHIKTQRKENGEEGDSSIIMDVDGDERDIDVITTYDDLIQEYVRINQSVENDKIDKNHAKYIKSVFVNNKNNVALNSEVENDIEELVETLNSEYAIVQATAKELNEYLGASNLNMLNSVVTTQKVNIKLYLALALVFFLFFGCAGAVLIGRLNDFVQYILYTDKITKLPNRQMCDVRINALSEKELGEQFTVMVVRLNNLAKLNESLGHSAGDTALREFGDILKNLSRNYGFVGWNQGGGFLCLYEQCSVEKADLFLGMLEKSVNDYNESNTELYFEYSIAYSNSTRDRIFDIRKLIRHAYDLLNKS
ncbi:MAG: diguanylate cyclase, partial [Eubacterium sp.]|nr:diguanylate cyclase [Eubacterium sp.]